jgi:hypothetical protein
MLEALKSYSAEKINRIQAQPKVGSVVVVIVLMLIEVWFISIGDWSGDYWEHSAVLKELIRDPWNPTHPIIRADIPHAFFSPYLTTLGIIGHYFAFSPFSMLSVMAMVNLGFLLFGLFLFIRIFFKKNAWNIYAPLLFLHLFAWGPQYWTYSSFFHFNTLHFVLPYPSTFAVGATFISAYLFAEFTNLKLKGLIIPVIITLNSVILLTHPTTFIFLMVLYAGISIHHFNQSSKWGLFFFISTAACFVIAAVWPYYPFLDLLTNQPSDSAFHLNSKVLYQNPILKILPAIPALFLFNQKDRLMILCVAMLTLIYIYGFITGQYGYGRVISFIVLMLHLKLAEWITDSKVTRQKLIVLVIVALLSLPYAYYVTKTFYRQSILTGKKPFYDQFKILEKYLDEDDLVMTDRSSIRYIPAFGGRVTATVMPPYWIADNTKRLHDIERFFRFSEGRRRMLSSYGVNYLLLTKNYVPEYRSFLTSMGLGESAIVFHNAELMLIKVR